MRFEVVKRKKDNLYYVRLVGVSTTLMFSKPYRRREEAIKLARRLQNKFSTKVPIFYKRYKNVVRET